MPTVAIVGCGDVASVHLAAIADHPEAELVGLCDSDPQALAGAVAEWQVPGFATVAELVDAVHPDVVHVCTPHAQHMRNAVDLLERGVHVILEKPLGSTLAEGRAIVDAAAVSGAHIGICFQNRYNPTSVALKQLLESGAFGAVLGARAQVMWTRTAAYYEVKPWRGTWEGSGGGLLMNQAIHTVDLVLWLLGDVQSVSGAPSTLLFGDIIEVEDTAVAVLEHESGVRTNFYATLTHFRNEPVLIEIVCEGGVLRLEGDLRVTLPNGEEQVLAEADVVRTPRSYWGASHERLIRDFYAHLADDEPFWISPEAAYASLAVAQAIYGRD